MKVKELIEELQKADPQKEIEISVNEGHWINYQIDEIIFNIEEKLIIAINEHEN